MSLPPPSPGAPPYGSRPFAPPEPPHTAPGRAGSGPFAPPEREPRRPLLPPSLGPAVARRLAAGAAVGGAGAALVGHHGVGTVAGALVGVAGPVALGAAAGVRRRGARVCLAAGAAFAPWLAWRDSHWLLPLDIVAGVLLVLAGAAQARRAPGGEHRPGRDDGFGAAARRVARAGATVVTGPAWAASHASALSPAVTSAASRRRLGAAARAVPFLLVIGVLLAWGDALVASWLRLPGAFDAWATDAILVAVGVSAFAGLHRAAAAPAGDHVRPPRAWRPARAVETTIVLGGAVALEVVFVAAQAVAALAGDGYVQRRTGLTYAEYARRGFFQLLAVAGIVLVIVLAARHTADAAGAAGDLRTRRRVRSLAVALVGVTVVLVAVAVHRLRLYEAAYGLTMLRLYSTVFALWLGGVLVVAAVAVVRPGPRRWLVPVVAGSALAGAFAMNVVNPEAVVVRQRVAFAARTGRLDAAYLATLSDDATPALAHAVRTAPPTIAQELRRELCLPAYRHHDARAGLAANLADRRSQRLTDELCAGA